MKKFDRGNVQIKEADIDAERPHFVVAANSYAGCFCSVYYFPERFLSSCCRYSRNCYFNEQIFPEASGSKSPALAHGLERLLILLMAAL